MFRLAARMKHSTVVLLLISVAIISLSSATDSNEVVSLIHGNDDNGSSRRRQLRRNRGNRNNPGDGGSGLITDPKTVQLRSDTPVVQQPMFMEQQQQQQQHTVSIHLTSGGMGGISYKIGYSFFETDILQRFGTGRVSYDVHNFAETTIGCDPNNAQHVLSAEDGPCLAVGHENDKYKFGDLQCSYPRCKTMVISNEWCNVQGYDIRQYHSKNIPGFFLPLGPRFDSWESFKKIQQEPNYAIPLSSERKYAFNAIFSQTTNNGRRLLSAIISRIGTEVANRPIFNAISRKFSRKPNDSKNDLLDTDGYVHVLHDSVFTLAPAGHNPECYRMYEAMEAGSIPVMIKSDLYITEQSQSACIGALEHFYDAPFLVLESWNDLAGAVENLLRDPKALNEMQARLGIWYGNYMRKVIADFEDLMLGSTVGGGVAIST